MYAKDSVKIQLDIEINLDAILYDENNNLVTQEGSYSDGDVYVTIYNVTNPASVSSERARANTNVHEMNIGVTPEYLGVWYLKYTFTAIGEYLVIFDAGGAGGYEEASATKFLVNVVWYDDATKEGENARETIYFPHNADIDNVNRFIPEGLPSHIHVEFKADGAADWTDVVEEYYIIYNYNKTPEGTTPARKWKATAAPIDGAFTTSSRAYSGPP